MGVVLVVWEVMRVMCVCVGRCLALGVGNSRWGSFPPFEFMTQPIDSLIYTSSVDGRRSYDGPWPISNSGQVQTFRKLRRVEGFRKVLLIRKYEE